MGKATEAANHLGVTLRPRQRRVEARFGCECSEKGDRAVLHCAILAVHERHIEKPAFVRFETLIEATGNGIVGRRERALVARKCVGRPAINVAGELIEDHNASERAPRIVTPFAERTGASGRDGRAEAVANRCIERRILSEPYGAFDERWVTEPEHQNFAGDRVERHRFIIRPSRVTAACAPLTGVHVRTTTSYRDIFLLSCCQALLLVNAAGLITMNGLVGYALTDRKTLATLGVTTYVLGSAISTLPLSLWMGKVGRRTGFMTGAMINIAGCALGATALWAHSFALYCLATAIIGVYNAIGLQYRFAAAEISTQADKAKAISLVLAGGIVGGFLGPESTRLSRDWFATPFLGSFLLLAAYALVAMAVQSRVRVPKPPREQHREHGRPLAAIMRQPVFIVAALSGGLGYGLMNLLMTATPIAMQICSHPFAATAFVIEWHVVGMFAPGFFTGSLIKRFGVLNVILAGLVLMASAASIALTGVSIAHFVVALVLVGIGWNFMYTGGTALLTEAYRPAERSRTQGINDFIVFATMAISSVISGALVSTSGWEAMNAAVLPLLAVIGAAVLWLQHLRRRRAARAATAD